MDFLNQEAEKENKSRRQVIEEAIDWYKKYKLKKDMFVAGNAIGDDEQEMNEWLSIANNPANL